MPSRPPPETIPVEALLADFSPGHTAVAERLRRIVRDAVPEAIERVRPGWRLIGYDLPIRRHAAFFAWIWPQTEHIHLGFPRGALMDDPNDVLRGDGITKAARWLTHRPGAVVDGEIETSLVLEAARVALIPRGLGLQPRSASGMSTAGRATRLGSRFTELSYCAFERPHPRQG